LEAFDEVGNCERQISANAKFAVGCPAMVVGSCGGPGEEETAMSETREQDVVVVEEAELLTPEEVTAVLEALLAEAIRE
jgi:hypothetical protein